MQIDRSKIKRGVVIQGGNYPAMHCSAALPPLERLEELADERDALMARLAEIRKRVAELRTAK